MLYELSIQPQMLFMYATYNHTGRIQMKAVAHAA